MSEKNSPFITDFDLHLFNSGRHYDLYQKMGAQIVKGGVHFSVWAPNAQYVSVIGDFNDWDREKNPLTAVESSGIWSVFVPKVKKGAHYKFHIHSHHWDYRVDKSDPYSYFNEVRPDSASVVWQSDYEWNDKEWMSSRCFKQSLDAPMTMYEVHLGSWKKKIDGEERSYTYREIADELPKYVKEMGYTHVEFMPLTEYPYDASWGYQVTGYFAPTSRYGTPEDFQYMIDQFHKSEIGVIMDWVPAHFPTDLHGLGFFDGTNLFEHSDPRQGFHPDWKTNIFNFDRTEVKSFLINSALCWFDRYHIDGLRVDAVASMLYLDYSRNEGEWIPNVFGGNENLGAISFIKELNEVVFRKFPDIVMAAEESTAYPGVSKPTSLGGLGFSLKWDMGWMNDTLKFYEKEAVHRSWHLNDLSFRMVYAFHENYVLSLSHDEVVHGKQSMLSKMPGDQWQKFANLRNLFAYMYAMPGKKLTFMGSEFGMYDEWNCENSIDWHLLNYAENRGMKDCVTELNRTYRNEGALNELDFSSNGFEWIDFSDGDNTVIAFVRKAKDEREMILCVLNLTPVVRENYRLGVPRPGVWKEIFNSDAEAYWGSNVGNLGEVHAEPIGSHWRENSINITIPPLGALYLKWSGY